MNEVEFVGVSGTGRELLGEYLYEKGTIDILSEEDPESVSRPNKLHERFAYVGDNHR